VLAKDVGTIVTEPAGIMELGNVLVDEVRDLKFGIVNRTAKPVVVSRVRAGCACTLPQEPPRAALPPGGKAQIGLRFVAAKVSEGAFERSAIVELADAPVGSVTLTFRGTVVRAISVRPAREVTLLPNDAATATWEQVFQVRSNLAGGPRLRLGAPVTSARLVAVLRETAASAFEVTVRPQQPLPRGRIDEAIRLPVLEPAGHEPLLLRILGQNGPMLLAIPASVRVADDGSGNPLSASVTLFQVPPLGGSPPTSFRASRKGVAVADITCTLPPGVTVAPTEQGTSTVLRFTFESEVVKAGGEGKFEIGTGCCGNLALPYAIRRATGNAAPR